MGQGGILISSNTSIRIIHYLCWCHFHAQMIKKAMVVMVMVIGILFLIYTKVYLNIFLDTIIINAPSSYLPRFEVPNTSLPSFGCWKNLDLIPPNLPIWWDFFIPYEFHMLLSNKIMNIIIITVNSYQVKHKFSTSQPDMHLLKISEDSDQIISCMTFFKWSKTKKWSNGRRKIQIGVSRYRYTTITSGRIISRYGNDDYDKGSGIKRLI